MSLEPNMGIHLTQPPKQSALTDGTVVATGAIDPKVFASLEDMREVDEPDLIVELIDLYLGDAPQWVEAIHTAAAGGDALLLKRAAHTLKGSSGSLGVRHVAQTCQMLEQLTGSESDAQIDELSQLLDRQFATACDALSAERTRRIA